MFADADQLLDPAALSDERAEALLREWGFDDVATARKRLASLCEDDATRGRFADCLPGLLHALTESASPDTSLLNFERFVQSVPDRRPLFEFLCDHPRAVEILIKLFVGSQFLTEILLRQPEYLRLLTQHRRLAEFKHRAALTREAKTSAAEGNTPAEKLDEVRRFQKWELLRLGACDTFGLMDLKTVTLQLALLADSVTQVCLDLIAADLSVDESGFAVLAFGKLGGEELNYSSDIDLVFVAREGAERYWGLGQKLIKALMDATAQGFMYRVDMRLRPWGRSGPLVCNVDAYVDYLRKNGRLWEKQALLKARCIAGNHDVGCELLDRLQPIIFDVTPDEVRRNVLEMKQKIESHLARSGRAWGEVKAGQGSIRDVEFVVQGLQLIHGREQPAVRSINTLDGIVRLADMGYVQADEYRRLRTGYSFLRTIEHALQLMHNKQMHSLPQDRRELAYLARRLDFPGAEEFVKHYEQHCREIRAVFDKYIVRGESAGEEPPVTRQSEIQAHFGVAAESYEEIFDEEHRQRHLGLLEELDEGNIVRIDVRPLDDDRRELTVVGFDQIGDLSAICGLLFVFGYNIESGDVFTGAEVPLAGGESTPPRDGVRQRKFVDVFTVRPPPGVVPPDVWQRYQTDLDHLLRLLREDRPADVHGQLAKRVASALGTTSRGDAQLLPVEIAIENETSPEHTILDISATDTVGFLYELTNALSLSGISIIRMQIRSLGDRVIDTLHVTDRHGKKIADEQRLLELRAAIVLIKHFTHLLPSSPNPEKALLHFRELLEQLFAQPSWINELAQLQNSDVLNALAKLLGVSDFLWHDFLKLQHANLFPVITDLASLQDPKSRETLQQELDAELRRSRNGNERRTVLNQFKDREMLRVDMRHILGLQGQFGMFSLELTDVAEVIVEAARRICAGELTGRHGVPLTGARRRSRLAVCALGKCGGRELGFASDIELMFVYEADGQTDGDESISCVEFYQSLVECFRKSIHTRRKGIFEVDLRLRPYGSAGSLAVSLETFEKYFGPDGPAWPYERQALVKLRPIAADADFGAVVVATRDRLIYTGEPFDVLSMRAMREKQIHQLVEPGTFNAKLSPGGLVDCEYIVQGLQITHGASDPALREPNTREALKALEAAGLISSEDRITLRDAYRFFRRVIDGLRMVRGDARDLTVPSADSEEFEFLARRLEYGHNLQQLQQELERHTQLVRDLTHLLDPAT